MPPAGWNITDSAFGEFLENQAANMPAGSIIPRSLYLVKAILQAKALWTVEWHVCPCSRHAWPPQEPKDWAVGVHMCPHCREDRFTATELPTKRVVIRPKQASARGQ